MDTRLKDYELTELIHSSSRSLVYRGIHTKTGERVVIKILNPKKPSPENMARLEHEYRIIKVLEFSGVIKSYGLEKSSAHPALVLEDERI